MVDRPIKFSQFEVRNKWVEPKELESWIDYIRQSKLEDLRNAGIDISAEDLHLAVYLRYIKVEMESMTNSVIWLRISANGKRPDFFTIVSFESADAAMATFSDYVNFKNIKVEKSNGIYISEYIAEL